MVDYIISSLKQKIKQTLLKISNEAGMLNRKWIVDI